jgi:hypothetical protein
LWTQSKVDPIFLLSFAADHAPWSVLLMTASGSENSALPSNPSPQGEAAFARPVADYCVELSGDRAIPGYEVLGQIHRGGLGVVLLAVQQSTNRTVALKVLLEGKEPGDRRRLRFEREVDLAARLHHPNIVTIYDSGVTPGGMPFCAMEFIDGDTLGEWVRRDGPKPLPEVLRLFNKICMAVNYAHQHGVIHRDLKPNNILVDGNGEPKILDFGLAKPAVGAEDDEPMTLTGEFLGTLAYAAPEQVRADPSLVDTRTDVYALGILLYELLTGHFPYRLVGTLPAVFDIIASAAPWPASSWRSRQPDPLCGSGDVPQYHIDEGLDAIVLKTLAKDREERYQSAGALAEDLRRHLSGEPLQIRPPSVGFALRAWMRRNFRATLWVLLVGVVCGSLTRWDLLMKAVAGLQAPLSTIQEKFPNVQLPWPARFFIDLPSWMETIFYIIGFAASTLMGLLVVRLLRPRDKEEDFAAGAGVGVIAAIMAFTVGNFAWGVVLATTVQPAQDDLRLLSSVDESQRKQLLTKYPQLAGLPLEEQQRYLAAKLTADLVLRIQAGVQVGLWLPLASFGLMGIAETLTAGWLWRRRNSFWRVVMPYFEIIIPVVYLTRVDFFLRITARELWPSELIALIGLAGALLGQWRRWPAPMRAVFYAAGFHIWLRLNEGGDLLWQDSLVAVVAALAVVVAEVRRAPLPAETVKPAAIRPTLSPARHDTHRKWQTIRSNRNEDGEKPEDTKSSDNT